MACLLASRVLALESFLCQPSRKGQAHPGLCRLGMSSTELWRGEGEGGVSVAAAQARQSSTVIEQGCLRDATSFIYGPSEEGEGRHKRGPGGLRRPCFQMGREGGLERGPPPLLRRTCLDLCCCLFLHFDAQEPSLHISFFWGLLGDAGGLPSDKGEY